MGNELQFVLVCFFERYLRLIYCSVLRGDAIGVLFMVNIRNKGMKILKKKSSMVYLSVHVLV